MPGLDRQDRPGRRQVVTVGDVRRGTEIGSDTGVLQGLRSGREGDEVGLVQVDETGLGPSLIAQGIDQEINMGVLVGLDRLELADVLVGVQAGQVVWVARLGARPRPANAATAAAPAAAPRSRNDRRPGPRLNKSSFIVASRSSIDDAPGKRKRQRNTGYRPGEEPDHSDESARPSPRRPSTGASLRHHLRTAGRWHVAIDPARHHPDGAFRSTVPAGFERTPAGSATGPVRGFQRHSTFRTSIRLRGKVEGLTSDTGGPPRA